MAATKRKLTPGELWLLELERERYDTTWTNRPVPSAQPQIIFVPPNAKQQRERDNIMFHAGRYHHGARDKAATEAHAKAAALIKK